MWLWIKRFLLGHPAADVAPERQGDQGLRSNAERTVSDGQAGLVDAVRRGDVEMVKAHIARGLDSRGFYAELALVVASGDGREDLARRLLDAGVSPDAADSAGKSAILCATLGRYASVVRLLLDRGARPNRGYANADAVASLLGMPVDELPNRDLADPAPATPPQIPPTAPSSDFAPVAGGLDRQELLDLADIWSFGGATSSGDLVTSREPFRRATLRALAQIWGAADGIGRQIELLPLPRVEPFGDWAESVSPVTFRVTWCTDMSGVRSESTTLSIHRVAREDGEWRIVSLHAPEPRRAFDAADRRAGSLVAQALGDALGFLVEGAHPVVCARFADEAFRSLWPPKRQRGPFAFGQYSDDTQLARELALSIVEGHGWDPAGFARRVAHLFATDTIVGRGRATEAAAQRLIAGVPWNAAGEPAPSAGNGAAMRAGPVGLAFPDPEERLRVADEQARVTHEDPRARAAAVLVADVVADACARMDEEALGEVGGVSWCEMLASRVEAMDPALARGLRGLPDLLAGPEEHAAATITAVTAPPRNQAHRFEEWHGISPFATPSALYAVFAYARSPEDPDAVLKRAVAVGGDVDTVAAMAGAMVGAAVGLEGLGPRLSVWAACLQDQGTFGFAELVALGHRLARESERT